MPDEILAIVREVILKPIKFVSLSAISKTIVTAIDIWVRTRNGLSPGIGGLHEPIINILIPLVLNSFLDALLHDFHCCCIDCKCLGEIKN